MFGDIPFDSCNSIGYLPLQKESDENNVKPNDIVDGKYYRLPLWILLSGIGISQLIGLLQYLFGY